MEQLQKALLGILGSFCDMCANLYSLPSVYGCACLCACVYALCDLPWQFPLVRVPVFVFVYMCVMLDPSHSHVVFVSVCVYADMPDLDVMGTGTSLVFVSVC